MIPEVIYSWKVYESEKHAREGKTVYVTDLVRCSLKRDFEVRYPELVYPMNFNPSIILGDLVHIGLEKLLTELKWCDGEVRAEVEGERKVGEWTVKGRIDAMAGGFGVEIKSAKSDMSIPHRHHILQCEIYNWLFDLPKTYLVYITPNRVADYEITGRKSDEEVASMIASKKAPMWDWECGYCPFSMMCPEKVVL